MDFPAPRVVLALTATTAKTESLVLLAIQEKMVHVVLQENQDRGGLWVCRAFAAGVALPVHRASPVLVVLLVPKEIPAATACKVLLAPVESPAKMDATESPPFCPANQAHPALLAKMVVPVSMAPLAFLVKTAETVRTA
jgi:hypothetical protein